MIANTPWPSMYEYALAHRCPICKAPVGDDCDAPGKAARQRRMTATRRRWGEDDPVVDRANLQHAQRIDAGIRHYYRDLGRAPWPEEREPGKRYDTLPRATEEAS